MDILNIKHIGKYTIFELDFIKEGMKKEIKVPILIDRNIYDKIKDINTKWMVNEKGFVLTYKKTDGIRKEIYLHDLVMFINERTEHKPILHINRIGLDNRFENLIYDVKNKQIERNNKKKDRTTKLADKLNMPTYVWYMRSDDTHGDRFVVNIDNIIWKTTSSRELSTEYKLEEAKKFLRVLKLECPEIFEKYSMNGDLNGGGKKLLESFYKIATKAKYNLNVLKFDNTNKYIKEDLTYLSDSEKKLLQMFNPKRIIDKIKF